MSWRKSIAFLVALALGMGAAMPSGFADEDKIKRIERDIQRAQEESKSLQKQQQRTEAKLREVKRQEKLTVSEINRLSQEIDRTQNKLEQVRGELARAEARLAATTAELERAEQRLAERTELLHRRVRAIYEHGTLTYLDVLMSARSFNDFLTRFENLQRVVSGDVRLFYDVRAWRSKVSEQKARQEQDRARVMAVMQQVEETKAHLERQKDEREQLYRDLLDDKKALERALDELEEKSRQITATLRRLEEELEKELRVEGALKLAHPLPGAPVTSPFGMRVHPILGKVRMHTGIDYAAPYGTPIRAAESGKVFQAGWMGGYGQAVIIIHGKGVSTLYGHMSKINVESGQMVKKGDVIGLVGSTGLSTGPHLHFEVRINGEPQNPAAYIGRLIM